MTAQTFLPHAEKDATIGGKTQKYFCVCFRFIGKQVIYSLFFCF